MSLPSQEHGIFFHVFLSSFVSFCSILRFFFIMVLFISYIYSLVFYLFQCYSIWNHLFHFVFYLVVIFTYENIYFLICCEDYSYLLNFKL